MKWVSFWDDDQFKKEQKLWYQIAQATGFKDIEDENQRYLKEWDSNFFRNQFNQIKYEATTEYYRAGSELLRSYPFKDEMHKRIWQLHLEGLSEREIARQVKRHKKSSVHKIISKIASRIKRYDG